MPSGRLLEPSGDVGSRWMAIRVPGTRQNPGYKRSHFILYVPCVSARSRRCMFRGSNAFHAGTFRYFSTRAFRDAGVSESDGYAIMRPAIPRRDPTMSWVRDSTGTLVAIVSSPVRGRGTSAVTPMIPSNRTPLHPRDSRRLRFLPVKATRRDTPCDTPDQAFSNSCATRRSVSES